MLMEGILLLMSSPPSAHFSQPPAPPRLGIFNATGRGGDFPHRICSLLTCRLKWMVRSDRCKLWVTMGACCCWGRRIFLLERSGTIVGEWSTEEGGVIVVHCHFLPEQNIYWTPTVRLFHGDVCESTVEGKYQCTFVPMMVLENTLQ